MFRACKTDVSPLGASGTRKFGLVDVEGLGEVAEMIAMDGMGEACCSFCCSKNIRAACRKDCWSWVDWYSSWIRVASALLAFKYGMKPMSISYDRGIIRERNSEIFVTQCILLNKVML